MGTNPSWPNRDGTAGGVSPDGHAQRHSEPYLDARQQTFGSTPAGAVTTNSRGGGWVALPKNPIKTAPYTTRDQRGGKR